LLAAMLGAMGVDAGQIYLASALPRHTPAADWQGLAASGLGEVLMRHIALAAPRRLLVLGDNILPLLGHALTNSPAVLTISGQSTAQDTDRHIPVLALPELGMLLERPAAKAHAWRHWLNWQD